MISPRREIEIETPPRKIIYVAESAKSSSQK